MDQKKDEHMAVLMLVMSSVIWSFNNVLTKLALAIATPWTLLSWRFILALVLLSLPVLAGKEKLRFRGKRIRPLILYMIIEPVYFIFESFAIKLTNATYTSGILAVSPITSTLFAALLIHEFPSRREVFFSLFPVAGILLMTLAGGSAGIITPLGAVCLAGTCLSASGIRICNRDAALEYSAYERTYSMMVSCCIYFTFQALREARFDLGVYTAPLRSPMFVFCLTALVILCSIGSNLMGNYAAGKLSVVRYTTLSSIGTLISLFTGVIFLHEPMTPVSFTGALLIIVGLQGMSRTRARRIEHHLRLHLPHLPHAHTPAQRTASERESG